MKLLILALVLIAVKAEDIDDDSNDGNIIGVGEDIDEKIILVDEDIDDDNIDEKVIGGTRVAIQQFPHQIALLANGRIFCGGSKLSNAWVVTAGHCVSGMATNRLTVRANSVDSTTGGQVINVARVIIHPQYNPTRFDFDVAMLRVNGLTSGRAISLPSSQPPAGANVWVTGWGATRNGGPVQRYLLGAQMNIISRASCGRYFTLTDRMICAQASRKSSCNGDSGGPLTYGRVLAGIVSFGRATCPSNTPSVYTNVYNVKSFIIQNLNSS